MLAGNMVLLRFLRVIEDIIIRFSNTRVAVIEESAIVIVPSSSYWWAKNSNEHFKAFEMPFPTVEFIKIIYERYPANKYMFRFKYGNIRKRSDIRSKLTIKTPERLHWCCSSFFVINFKNISHLFLLFLLFTLNR